MEKYTYIIFFTIYFAFINIYSDSFLYPFILLFRTFLGLKISNPPSFFVPFIYKLFSAKMNLSDNLYLNIDLNIPKVD